MNKLFKRSISVFLALCICFLNVYFMYIDVNAGIVEGVSSFMRLYNHFNEALHGNYTDDDHNYVPVESLVNGDLYGRGKYWDELTTEQKMYRAVDTYAYWANRIDTVLCDSAKVVYKKAVGDNSAANTLISKMRSDKAHDLAVLWQAETVDEALIRKAGLGDLIDSKDFVPSTDLEKVEGANVVKQAADVTRITLDSELRNMFQDFLNSQLDGKKVIYGCTPDNRQNWEMYRLEDPENNDNSYYRNFAKTEVNEHGFVWNCKSGDNKFLCYLDGNIQDYYVYVLKTSSHSAYGSGGSSGPSFSYNQYLLGFKSKSGEPFYMNYVNMTAALKGNYVVNTIKSSETGVFNTGGSFPCYGYDQKYIKDCMLQYSDGMRWPEILSFKNNSGIFIAFDGWGSLSSEQQFGPQEPLFIQDPRANVYHNESYIGSYDDSHHYNYNYFISQVDNDPSALTDEKIMELFDRLDDISDHTENIDYQTEESNSWLKKIYNKLDDIYEKIGSGGSSIWDGVTDFIHWTDLSVKLDAIIALLGIQTVSDWVDDITDKGADIVDIGTDIGEQLVLKFPFCIPWDIMAILNTLEALPETPVFEVPFKIQSWGIDTTFTLDLSEFETLSQISKWFFDVLYGIAITKLTLKILQVEFVGSSG